MRNEPVTRLIDALSVRTRLGEVMEQAEKENVRFLVSRRGKPTVVILSVNDYLRSVVKKDELLAEIQFSARTAGLDRLTDARIDAEIQASRRSKRKPGK
ncbi:MAG TPA: type II toxin-antitoxin system prevent-host-death family antitoxin [Syntrophobacter fumaroxidans]|nr:type II toxin-antitoxin system prevent-host-death family antitoxin [Syntrophobacter fumaroxidans]